MLNCLAAHKFAVEELNRELSGVEDQLGLILELLEQELSSREKTNT